MPPGLLLSRVSFRSQIALLGTLVLVLFLAVLVATSATLRYTKSSMLVEEQKGLYNTASTIAREYMDQEESDRQSKATPLLNLATDTAETVLTRLSGSILQSVDGAEGGFYSATRNQLVGYAFPTRATAADTSTESASAGDVPSGTRSAIIEVAQQAVSTRRSAELVINGDHDIVLIEAMPIREGNAYTGSAWAIKRLPSLPGTNRFRAYLIAVVLGIAALTSVILTLLIVRNLQNGVRTIEGGLKDLEGDLSSQIPIGNDPDEIRRITQAVNRLATALKRNMEREKQIEDRLRHAEKLAALGRLVAGVAHEVRNPLATIRLRLQMCELDADNPQVHESCVVALEEIERLNGMVNRLLNFAQPIRLRAEPTDLRHLAEQRLNGFREKAQVSGINIVTEYNDGGQVLQLDRNRMAQVFDNVIQNAIEAMSESGGTLRVSVASETKTASGIDRVRVEFRDTGKGVSTNTISRIFDPFFTTKPSGTGLGLSICHELVRAHGGEIYVESEEGNGTSVRILLPVRDNLVGSSTVVARA
jgi:signal transduction histidine kinase